MSNYFQDRHSKRLGPRESLRQRSWSSCSTIRCQLWNWLRGIQGKHMRSTEGYYKQKKVQFHEKNTTICTNENKYIFWLQWEKFHEITRIDYEIFNVLGRISISIKRHIFWDFLSNTIYIDCCITSSLYYVEKWSYQSRGTIHFPLDLDILIRLDQTGILVVLDNFLVGNNYTLMSATNREWH